MARLTALLEKEGINANYHLLILLSKPQNRKTALKEEAMWK